MAFYLEHIVSDGIVDTGDTSLDVVLDGCRFEANRIVADNEYWCPGLVCAHTEDVRLTVRNCVFLDNDVAYDTDRSVLIDVAEGARLTLDTNCFVNNTVVGPGLINLHQPEDFVSLTKIDSNNGRDNVIQRTTCEATHFFTTDECLAFGAPSCNQLPTPSNPIAMSPVSSATTLSRLLLPCLLVLIVCSWPVESSS